MMENFDALEKAIDSIGEYVDSLIAENDRLKNDLAGMKSTLDDRNQEIAQLQQEIQQNATKVSATAEANAAYEKRTEGLLARVRAMQQRRVAQQTTVVVGEVQQLRLMDDE